jgi:hypothetical protein
MPDPRPEEKPEEKGNLPEAVTKALEDIKAGLENLKPEERPDPAPGRGPGALEEREALKKTMGFSEEQMQAHEQMLRRSQAPLVERDGWRTIEGKSDFKDLKSEIDKEVAIYPSERRTPEMMEKIYYMVKGRHADSKPKETPKPGRPEERISRGPGYSGADPGMPAGGGGPGEGGPTPEETLNDSEKFVVSKLRDAGVQISDKEYAKSRNAGRSIRELRPEDNRRPTSLADIELSRMKGGR